VSAAFTRPTIAPDVEDTSEIHFRTRDGTLGRIALSWTYFTKDLDYLMVQGTEGGLRVGWTGGLQRRHGERDWSPFGTGYSKGGAFASQLDAFVGAVRSGPASPDPSEAIRAIGFIEAAYRAADDWRWQTVADPH
jgi:predicted dehydrogenase